MSARLRPCPWYDELPIARQRPLSQLNAEIEKMY